jgi:hypothetical protein
MEAEFNKRLADLYLIAITLFFHPWKALIIACLLITACASEIRSVPAEISPVESGYTFVLTKDILITLETNYTRKLSRNTRLLQIGSIPCGEIYKPLDTIFTIEGANIHEAYLVISGSKLVGFYLPGQNAFSSLSKQIHIPLQQEN